MIKSMTGFGADRREAAGMEATAEARSVNGRFLKLTLRLPPTLTAREHDIEALVRRRLRRGSVSLRVSVRETRPEALVSVNEEVVRAYQSVFRRLGVPEAPLATLPGVLGGELEQMSDERFAVVQQTIDGSLDALVAMRQHEGQALAAVLGGIADRIAALAVAARSRAPAVVGEYQAKLQSRLLALVADFGTAQWDAQMVAREVAVFASRCDVTEELDRLDAHVQHLRSVIASDDEAGRTLEFLGQELLREANTLGSKSNDAELTRTVIELKSELERLREQCANVE